MQANYQSIVEHYELCLRMHGDNHLGVDWPNEFDARTRYDVMLDVIRDTAKTPVSLLDFGCGTSHLYEHMLSRSITGVEYTGLDISAEFVGIAKKKFPANNYFTIDLLEDDTELPIFDYVVMNGVFTEKCGLSYNNMLEYFQRMLRLIFPHARRGIAFNVMSKHVDWERDDLFHLPMDTLCDFITKDLSRKFLIRNDYGLYDYTVYVYR